MDDGFGLSRFLAAQEPVLADVLRELAAGRKQTHWMWFIFPQVAGLGSSPTAVHYAIGSLAEAQAYIQHAVLGPRLRHCTTLVNTVRGRSATAIFGQPDDVKFRSCMTLFARATEEDALFVEALDRYFGGIPDPATLARLN